MNMNKKHETLEKDEYLKKLSKHIKRVNVIKSVKEALLAAWGILLILEHILLFLWLRVNGLQYVWFPVALIAMWWIISITVTRFKKKREQREKKNYKAKYIRQERLTDERFGTITFEWDTNEDTFEAYPCDLPQFGNDKPNSITAQIFDDTAPDTTLAIIKDALYALYAREEEIIEECVNYVKDTYDDEDIRDESGDLMTLEYIRDKFFVGGFFIYIYGDERGVTAGVQGEMFNDFMDHISEHGVTWEFKLDPNKITASQDETIH